MNDKLCEAEREIRELKERLKEADTDQQFLSALICAGVDNWSGYEEAQDMVKEWDSEE